jgi:hypothetical protein
MQKKRKNAQIALSVPGHPPQGTAKHAAKNRRQKFASDSMRFAFL